MPVSPADLKKAGLKVTLPRIRILEILESAEPHHLSAEDVYKVLLDDKWTIDFSLDGNETIGLATVYRVLTQFESAGIVERHNFDDGRAVFEMATEHHHDHMVDVDSGKVLEFVDERIERIQREIAAEHGFELVDHQLVLYVRRQRD